MAVANKQSKEQQAYLSDSDMLFLKNLQFAPRIRVDGAFSGKHKSPLRGQSQEFTDYRDYVPGDEIRKIDWKVYGRTDRHIIKLSEQETVMNCHILLDSSASMAFGGEAYKQHFGTQDISKFDFAGRLAAGLAYLLVKQGDKVALTLFDAAIKAHIPSAGTYSHLHHILTLLKNNRVGRSTKLSHTLREAYALMNRRGILIVISDFLDDQQDLFEALDMYRHRNFEVILFHVLHRYELDLPPLASVNFIDAETLERLTSIPREVRKSYQQQLSGFMESMATIASARRIDYECMSTETPPLEALQRYFERRTTKWHR
jgi:uncharacterized protein (DUF58 family)